MKKALVFFPRLLLFLTFSFLLVRCSDDDEPQTTADLLLGNWMITASIYNPPVDFGNGPVSDGFPFWDDCDKDDIYIIKANGVGEYNEGATKCDPGDPQTEAFTWALKSNNTILTISETTGGISVGVDYEIIQLDASTLKLKFTFDNAGVSQTITETYTRK